MFFLEPLGHAPADVQGRGYGADALSLVEEDGGLGQSPPHRIRPPATSVSTGLGAPIAKATRAYYSLRAAITADPQ
jgi:hypothetical protein